ncbi:MAG: signal peptidase I [Pseudomonadota bacterium]|nr:signal peptidase I [Pseudomonadota bacterium]
MNSTEPAPRSRFDGWPGELLRIGIALLLLVIFRSSFANHYVVPTGSMEYTLLPGDRVVVDMRAYGWRLPITGQRIAGQALPERGDVALFASPTDGERLIKRIVAVGGDTVIVRDGHLSVNGQPATRIGGADEEILSGHRYRLNLVYGGGPDITLRIPPGQVLAMGDARGNSFDGRMFGLVPADQVYARAVAVYWRRGEGPVWRGL